MASYFSSPALDVVVTQNECFAFHTIDRELFFRLLINLGRDPGESMQVMALWIWLEYPGLGQDQLIRNLREVAEPIINQLADEAVMVLQCIESEQFTPSIEVNNNEIPLTQFFTNSNVTLQYFYENREAIAKAVNMNINLICAKALADIVDNYLSLTGLQGPVMGPGLIGPMTNPVIGPGMGPMPMMLPTGFVPQGLQVVSNVRALNPNHMNVLAKRGLETYDLDNQGQILSTEVTDIFSRLRISEGADPGLMDREERREEAPLTEDDRTIFLTFSKGYPITETEVIDFFTRKYGNIVERLYMQEVQPGTNEQSLYARLVVYDPEIMDLVLEGQIKIKVIVNGKHMCARKYVPKSVSYRHGSGSGPPSPQARSWLGQQV